MGHVLFKAITRQYESTKESSHASAISEQHVHVTVSTSHISLVQISPNLRWQFLIRPP